MRHTLLILLLVIVSTGDAFSENPGVTVREIDRLASELLTASGVHLRGEVRADPVQAHGMAAVYWTGDFGIIFVDPVQLRLQSLNTWAFVIGHELAHRMTAGLAAGPRQEFEADRIGASWAVEAGYDLDAYISWIRDTQNGCSDSHGCWDERATHLAAHFGVADARTADGSSGRAPTDDEDAGRLRPAPERRSADGHAGPNVLRPSGRREAQSVPRVDRPSQRVPERGAHVRQRDRTRSTEVRLRDRTRTPEVRQRNRTPTPEARHRDPSQTPAARGEGPNQMHPVDDLSHGSP